MSLPAEPPVLAVDPGREKCGVAVVDPQRGALWHQVVMTDDLSPVVTKLAPQFGCRSLILGDQTFSSAVRQALQPLLDQAVLQEIVLIDECGSTEEARSRYWKAKPPTGWRKFIPLGLLFPPCAIDDFAAIILGERYFKKIVKKKL